MKSLARSQAARRRAAAAAAIAGVGAGILGTQSAEAGIVTIDLASAGSPGVDITGVSAGLPFGSFPTILSKTVSNFPLTGGGTLALLNFGGSVGSTGLRPYAGLTIAVDGGDASPHNFAGGASISTFGGTWSSSATKTYFLAYQIWHITQLRSRQLLGFQDKSGQLRLAESDLGRD